MDDDLTKKLKTWSVAPGATPRFNAGVWQKIAARNQVREQSAAYGLSGIIRALMMTWRGATAVVLLAVTLGAAAGGIEAHGVNAHRWNTLGARYADSINPLAISSGAVNR